MEAMMLLNNIALPILLLPLKALRAFRKHVALVQTHHKAILSNIPIAQDDEKLSLLA